MHSPLKESIKLNVADVQKGIKQYLQNDIFQDYRIVHKKYIQISLNEFLGVVGVSSDKIIPVHCGQIAYSFFNSYWTEV